VAEALMKSLLVKTVLGLILCGTIELGILSRPGQSQSPTMDLQQLVNQNWYDLPPREQNKALEYYKRYEKLPPEKKRAIDENYNRFQQLPPEEKDRLRRNYETYRGWNSDQKEEFNRKSRQWRRSQPR
jgi:hypothetical protein